VGGPAAIEFRGVSRAFGKRIVLKDISFSVAAGSTFVLLGRSGTGKSVTLKLICGLLPADSGAVLVDGKDIAGLDSNGLATMRRHLGFLFQSAALFDSISVGENVAFPLRRHTRKSDAEIHDRAQELLDRVGLGKEYASAPADLSGGMRKRAGLARALAMDPTLLLVDEPSAGLDPITAGEIDQLLIAIKADKKTTLVVVTHNIQSARHIADRMAFLDEGKVLAEGTVKELEQSELPLVQAFMKSGQGG
jgi:phospholipid/cholesterol/gamma-HCH transport system ATP-binding protein